MVQSTGSRHDMGLTLGCLAVQSLRLREWRRGSNASRASSCGFPARSGTPGTKDRPLSGQTRSWRVDTNYILSIL